MNITKCQSGGFRLPLNCDNYKVREIALDLIKNKDYCFTFNELCVSFARKAEEYDLFIKEPNTIYQDELKLDGKTISVILSLVWEMIWNKLLMIDLYRDDYRSTREGEFSLIKVDTK